MLKIAYYELKKLLRDTRWLIIFVFQPVILMILLGLVTYYEPTGIKVGLINNINNQKSEEFVQEIKNENKFNIEYFDDEQKLREEISKDGLKFGVIVNIDEQEYVSGYVEIIENSTVPEISAKSKERIAKIFENKATDFAKLNAQTDIDKKIQDKKSDFEVKRDNSISYLKQNIASLSLPAPLAEQLNQEVDKIQIKADFDLENNSDIAKIELVETKNTPKDLKYFDFYASAIIILLTILIALKLADTSITSERVEGTFERFFVTPYRKYHMIFGKMIAFVAIDLFLAGIIVATMALLFDVNLGPYWLVFLTAFISGLTAASLGIFISCITYTIAESIQVSNLIFFSFLILTGLIFQPESMHPIVKAISSVIPFAYLIKAMREINLLGMNFHDVWPELAIASLSIFVFLFLASAVLKRKSA